MRILLGTDSYLPAVDGGAVMEARLAAHLAGMGHSVKVLAPFFPGHVDLPGRHRPGVVRIKSRPAPGNGGRFVGRFSLRTIAAAVRRFDPDVIHVHNPGAIGTACLATGKVLRIPVVATNHMVAEHVVRNLPIRTFLQPAVAAVCTQWGMSFYNRADLVTVPSEHLRSFMVSRGLKTRCDVISNGVENDLFSPRAAASGPDKQILYAGRLDADKDVDRLLLASATIAHDLDLQVLIVGEGNQRDCLHTLARRLGIGDRVTFLPFVDRSRLAMLLQVAVAAVFPSPQETQCMVALEAMASGLPVVAVRSGALAETITDGVSGVLVDPENTAQLTHAIARVVGDDLLRKRLGAQARSEAARHDVTVVHGIWEATYDRVVAEATGRYSGIELRARSSIELE